MKEDTDDRVVQLAVCGSGEGGGGAAGSVQGSLVW